MKATLLLLAQAACYEDGCVREGTPFDKYRAPESSPFCGSALCYCPEAAEIVTKYEGPDRWVDGIQIKNGDSIELILDRLLAQCSSVGGPQSCNDPEFVESTLASICASWPIYSYKNVGTGMFGPVHEKLRSPLPNGTGLFRCSGLNSITNLWWSGGEAEQRMIADEFSWTPIQLGPNPCAVSELICIEGIMSSCQTCEHMYFESVGGDEELDCNETFVGLPRTISSLPREGDCDDDQECINDAEERHDTCRKAYLNAIEVCKIFGEGCNARYVSEAPPVWYLGPDIPWPGRAPTVWEANFIHGQFNPLVAQPSGEDPDTCWTVIGCEDFFNPEFNCMAWAFDFQHLRAQGNRDPYPKLPPTHCTYGNESPYYVFEDVYQKNDEIDFKEYLTERHLKYWLNDVGLQDWKIEAWSGSRCQSLSGITAGNAVIAYGIDKSSLFDFFLEEDLRYDIQHFARYEGPYAEGGLWSSKLGKTGFIVHRPHDLVNKGSLDDHIPGISKRFRCDNNISCLQNENEYWEIGSVEYGEPRLCIYRP